MSQYSRMKTSHAFQGCAKIVLWLYTARTENPDTPQTHLNASDFHEYHSDTPRHQPDIPQTPPNISRGQEMLTDDNRYQQTPPDKLKQHPSVSWGVWGCLFVLVVACCCLLASHAPWRGLGGVWGMSGGNQGVSEWYSWKSKALSCVWGFLGSQSLQYEVELWVSFLKVCYRVCF